MYMGKADQSPGLGGPVGTGEIEVLRRRSDALLRRAQDIVHQMDAINDRIIFCIHRPSIGGLPDFEWSVVPAKRGAHDGSDDPRAL